MGIYVFNRDLLAKRLDEDAGEPGSLHDFGYNLLPRMVKLDRVFAFEFKGYWHDIGTIEAYYEANMELLTPRPRFTLDSDWPILNESNILTVCRTNKEGNIINSLISPGCVIDGRVENSVLSPGVHVAEEAIIRNSVVMADASIGYHSIVNGCIVDENVNIGKFCYVGFGAGLLPVTREITVLGKDVTVPDHTAIGRKCNIRPGLGPDAFGARLIPAGTTLVHS
jgi:glucose-1-phosphate adenylyltransferase